MDVERNVDERVEARYQEIPYADEYILGASPIDGFAAVESEAEDVEEMVENLSEWLEHAQHQRMGLNGFTIEVPMLDVLWHEPTGQVWVRETEENNLTPSRFRHGFRFFRVARVPVPDEKEVHIPLGNGRGALEGEIPFLDYDNLTTVSLEYKPEATDGNELHYISEPFPESNRHFEPDGWRRLTDQLFALQMRHGRPPHGSEIELWVDDGEAEIFEYVESELKSRLSSVLDQEMIVLSCPRVVTAESWAARIGNQTRIYRYQNGPVEEIYLCVPLSNVEKTFKQAS